MEMARYNGGIILFSIKKNTKLKALKNSKVVKFQYDSCHIILIAIDVCIAYIDILIIDILL